MIETVLMKSLKQTLERTGTKEWDETDWERLYTSKFFVLFKNMHDDLTGFKSDPVCNNIDRILAVNIKGLSIKSPV